MKTKIIVLAILMIFALNMINADVIMPGHKVIPIVNKISNIEDFPDHIFILGGSFEGPSPLFVRVQMVQEDGTIPGEYYKLSSPSVFAIEKSKWDQEIIGEFMSTEDPHLEEESYQEFYARYVSAMTSMEAKEVIKELRNQDQVLELDPKEQEIKNYNIDLSQVKVEPESSNDLWKYVAYLGIPLIAILIVIIIIVRKNGSK